MTAYPERPSPPPEPTEQDRARERLAVMLSALATIVVGSGAILFLGVITLNYLFFVAAIAVGVALFGWLHWLLWGRFLS